MRVALFFVACLCAASVPARARPLQADGFFHDPVGPWAGSVTDEEEGEDDDPAEAESEETTPEGAISPDLRYSADLSDDELRRLWKDDLAGLGSISVGFADQGRVINAAHMPLSEAWVCQRPDLSFGTQETIDALATAFRAVHRQFPDSAPARLSQIGLPDGGYLRPHRSHQSGRDADIGFFYKNDRVPPRGVRRERLMDPARNWALIRALITETDVQVILVDRSIQKLLRSYALSTGEDPAWLEGLFGPKKIVQHARHHKDHFHVRFYAPRSQELGRRIQPLLAERPDQNVLLHRVRHGETLAHIARINRTTVQLIIKANRLHGSFLRLGQQLRVPLRGPCTRCPLPPAVVVPPRRVPSSGGAAVAASG